MLLFHPQSLTASSWPGHADPLLLPSKALWKCFLGSQLLPPGSSRTFTVFQLMTILQEKHHNFLIVIHDPLLLQFILLAHLNEHNVLEALRKPIHSLSVNGNNVTWIELINDPCDVIACHHLQHCLEMLLGRFHVVGSTGEGEAVHGLRVLGIDLESAAQIVESPQAAALLAEDGTQILESHGIAGICGKSLHGML